MTPAPEPTARLRPTIAIGVVAVLAIATAVAVMLWHASTIEVDEGQPIDLETAPIAGWSTPFGYVVQEQGVQEGDIRLVGISEEGSVLGRLSEIPGRLAKVSTTGAVLVFDNGDEVDPSSFFSATELTLATFDGSALEEQWSQGFTAQGSDEALEDLDLVAHDLQGRSVVYGCAAAIGCQLIGVDALGAEMWRIPADELTAATPAETAHDGRPWVIPEELVVIEGAWSGDGEDNHPIRSVDVATGATTDLTDGARVVAGNGFHVTTRTEGDECQIEVLREQQVRWQSTIACSSDGRAPHFELFGETLTSLDADRELVVIDLGREEVGRLPERSARGSLTGAGTLAERTEDGAVVLRRTADQEVLHEYGSDWRIGDVGSDAVVLYRERTSRNPLAPGHRTEVVVHSASTGDLCADITLEGRPGRTLALAGCRAVVEVDDQFHLLGL